AFRAIAHQVLDHLCAQEHKAGAGLQVPLGADAKPPSAPQQPATDAKDDSIAKPTVMGFDEPLPTPALPSTYQKETAEMVLARLAANRQKLLQPVRAD